MVGGGGGSTVTDRSVALEWEKGHGVKEAEAARTFLGSRSPHVARRATDIFDQCQSRHLEPCSFTTTLITCFERLSTAVVAQCPYDMWTANHPNNHRQSRTEPIRHSWLWRPHRSSHPHGSSPG